MSANRRVFRQPHRPREGGPRLRLPAGPAGRHERVVLREAAVLGVMAALQTQHQHLAGGGVHDPIFRHTGGGVRLEKHAHDSYVWATEEEWRELTTWYTKSDSDALWAAAREMRGRA